MEVEEVDDVVEGCDVVVVVDEVIDGVDDEEGNVDTG